MLRVGLTGGFATGKSFVGKALEDVGCHLLKADEIGHAVMAPDGAAYPEIVHEFGPEILAEDGRIDRRKLGAQVFGDPAKLGLLNSFIHPHVIEEEERWMARIGAADPHAIAVVEAAILIETGSYKRFQKIVLTVCDRELQIERAMRRDNLSREEVLDRLNRQMPLDEKRKYADFVVDTSGAKASTIEQVARLNDTLRSLEK
jgi:dephospho-CoA kinase